MCSQISRRRVAKRPQPGFAWEQGIHIRLRWAGVKLKVEVLEAPGDQRPDRFTSKGEAGWALTSMRSQLRAILFDLGGTLFSNRDIPRVNAPALV